MTKQNIHDKAGRLLDRLQEFNPDSSTPTALDDQARALALIAQALALLVAAQTVKAEQTMK